MRLWKRIGSALELVNSVPPFRFVLHLEKHSATDRAAWEIAVVPDYLLVTRMFRSRANLMNRAEPRASCAITEAAIVGGFLSAAAVGPNRNS